MNPVDILLIVLIAAAVLWAASRCMKNARCGGCNGCTGCAAEKENCTAKRKTKGRSQNSP